MVSLLCVVLAVAAACKRHESQGAPNNNDACGRKLDCLLCTADAECGWCGGTHCGPTGSGCYIRTLHEKGNVCRHEVHKKLSVPSSLFYLCPQGDFFGTSANTCEDLCKDRSNCGSCLSSPLQPSLTSRGLRCGWTGAHCVIGNATSPVFPHDHNTWRWSDSPHVAEPRFLARLCALYRPCGEAATRCAECTGSFASAASDCFFCTDNSSAVGVEGDGGGRCVSEREKCATSAVWWNNQSFCPAMPQPLASASTTQTPEHVRAQGFLLYGTMCLFLVGMLFGVYKLSE